MNVSVSDKSESQDVKSKYFTGRSAMDESLSDFQEPKKSTAGPKSSVSKSSRPKKAPKRIRGQKDIRAALRSKKNELKSYSEDFDKVCKKAGIDVDPEQLQLAIALSKSLQETASTSQETETRPITTQERLGKIRTTLQEYGFKVPNVKTVVNTRKVKKHRKNYKLILTSETEKQEIIANKYSQVLFQNIPNTSLYYSEVNTSDIQLFYLASNAPYSTLKCTDTFYVNNLIEKSTSTGNLLKDWSEIPGRPVSPKLFEPSNMNFSEIECSQDEIDIVLSGSLKRCKNIFNAKQNLSRKKSDFKGGDDISIENIEVQNISVIDYDKTLNEAVNRIENMKGKVDRSSSPDLFEDDESSIFDNNRNSFLQSELNPSDRTNKTDLDTKHVNVKDKDLLNSISDKPTLVINTTKRKSNDFMELTECIQIAPEYRLNKLRYPLSQNITKRRSNDLMEITECVATYMHPQNNIDLTQDPDIIEAYWAEENTKQNLDQANSNLDNLKEKACTENQGTHLSNISQKNDKNATSAEENNKPENENPGNSIESMDLTQSSNTSDELPFVSLTRAKENLLDDTIIVNYDNTDINKKTNLQKPVEHIDLTQNSRIESHSQSFFDEYVHDNKDDLKYNSNNTNHETDLIQGRTKKKLSTTSNHSNSQRKSPRNVSNSQPNTKNISSQDNSPSKYYEEHVPVELYSSNGYKYLKADKVDLTQSTERDVAFVSNEQNCRESLSYSQSSKSRNTSTERKENYSPTSKANNVPITVEFNVSNSGSDTCKSDHIDLIQAPVRQFTYNTHNENVNKQSSNLLSSFPKDKDNIRQSQDEKIASGHECLHTRQFNNCPHLNYEQRNCNTVNVSKNPIKHGNDFSNKIQDDDDIDLTQSSNSSVELTQVILRENFTQIIDNNGEVDANIPSDNNVITPVKYQTYSSLGKKDDISIDYDDFIIRDTNKDLVQSKNNSSVSNETADENVGNLSRNNSFLSNCSQNSEVFEISDKELDYSLHKSKVEIPTDNFVFGGISIMDELSNFGASKKSGDFDTDFAKRDEEIVLLPTDTNKRNKCKEISPIKHRRITEIATPLKPSSSNMVTVVTPKNSELVIKTNNITPMLDYQSMSTPEIHIELDKFGIKPFKRKRAIQLLTHIYNQTHPIIEHLDELASPPKRHKPNIPSPKKLISPRKLLTSTKDPKEQNHTNKDNIFDESNVITNNKGKGTLNKTNARKGMKKNSQSQNIEDATEKDCSTQSKEVVTDVPILQDVECKPEDWVFQKREKAKVHSCRVPLHIAFYNYVSSRRDLREAILCYEPVEIDIIHKDLVAYGHRYDPKDLLRFLDKKCITVKTTDNDARNQKR